MSTFNVSSTGFMIEFYSPSQLIRCTWSPPLLLYRNIKCNARKYLSAVLALIGTLLWNLTVISIVVSTPSPLTHGIHSYSI